MIDDDLKPAHEAQGLGVVEALTRGEVDMQVATAKRYPRSLKRFKEESLTMATLDEDTAAACFYSLPRGGKNIEGPGVRLAEIVASCWGNLRCEARVVGSEGSFIVAQGTAWDMERNVLVRVEVRRRATDRNGKPFNDDMMVVTGNAAAAIAFRNAVFKVVPSALTKVVYDAARQVAIGDARTLSQRRALAFEWFGKAGVTADQVLATLGKPSIEDVDLSDLGTLQGLRTAIQEGSTSIDEAFAPAPMEPGTKGFGFGKGKAKAAEKPKASKPTPAAEPEPEPEIAPEDEPDPEAVAAWDAPL